MHMLLVICGRENITSSFSLFSFVFILSSTPLDKAGTEESADKNNSAANQRHLAHVAHDQ